MPSYEFDRLEETAAPSDQTTCIEDAPTAPVRRRGRRLLLGASLAVGAVAALALKKTLTPCPPASDAGDALVSLAEVHMEISDLMKNNGDPDAMHKWLATQAAEAAAHVDDLPAAQEAVGKAKRAVARALDANDGTKAKEIVKRAMENAKIRWRSKREDLKSHLSSSPRALRFPKPTPSPQKQAGTAECVFNVEQATTQVAALSANIADSAKTCITGAKFKNANNQGRTCVVNLAAIGYSVATVAGSLSLAAENCANTVISNTEALCSGSISGLVAEVSQLAGAAALTNQMCDPVGKDAIPPGEIPSHLGQPEIKRRLAEHNTTGGAEARRLLFGGGYGSDATQCAVDVTSVMWWLAQAGLAINAAGNTDAGSSCPNSHKTLVNKLLTKKITKKFPEAKEFVQASCTVDIAGAVFAFGQVIQYLQFAVSHCADELNVEGLCGAGIDGMVSSLAGMASSGPALWITCGKLGFFKGAKARKAALNMAAIASTITRKQNKNKLSLTALAQSGNFGRRLADEEAADPSGWEAMLADGETADPSGEEAIAEMKKRFATPEDAWKSIGYDFDDANAAWRDNRPKLRQDELVSLLEEPSSNKQEGRQDVLGGMQMCTPQA